MTSQKREVDTFQTFGLEAIREAGEKALAYFGKGKGQKRFDSDLVTQTELHLMQFIQKELQARFPDHQLYQSGYKDEGYTHDSKRYLWVFDPLDGSANFQAGIPIWGMSLALVENYWPIFGIYLIPTTGDMFHALAGHQAYHDKTTMKVSPGGQLDNESLIFTFARFHQHYRCAYPGKIRDFGCTGAHVCYVAAGWAEAAITSNESFKDLAALRIILEAAGGKICKMDGNELFLNEYITGHRIDGHQLIGNQETCRQVRGFLEKTT